MPELMEPTRVDRPTPWATWVVDNFDVRRHTARGDDKVSLGRVGATSRERFTPATALQLGAALSAAAEWTDDDVVDATIIDDRPRVEYRWLIEGLSQTRRPWMTDAAARGMGEDLAGWLAHRTPVVIVRDGAEWAP